MKFMKGHFNFQSLYGTKSPRLYTSYAFTREDSTTRMIPLTSAHECERCEVGEVIIEGSRTGHAPRKYEQRESNVRGRDQF